MPILMMVSDGFLMAWLLTELRAAGFDNCGEDRLELRQAIALMPGSVLACALALPARYVATFVWLGSGYLPTWAHATSLGRGVRWQLGWGLTDLQAVALVVVGLAGGVPWSRGTIRGSFVGYRRLLATDAGHLVAVLLMAGLAAGLLASAVYAILLLLPAQSWVLGRPIAMPIMSLCRSGSGRSPPSSSWPNAPCRPLGRQSSLQHAPAQPNLEAERFSHHDTNPAVAAPRRERAYSIAAGIAYIGQPVPALDTSDPNRQHRDETGGWPDAQQSPASIPALPERAPPSPTARSSLP